MLISSLTSSVSSISFFANRSSTSFLVAGIPETFSAKDKLKITLPKSPSGTPINFFSFLFIFEHPVPNLFINN